MLSLRLWVFSTLERLEDHSENVLQNIEVTLHENKALLVAISIFLGIQLLIYASQVLRKSMGMKGSG